MHSAIYQGWVRHRRFTPRDHEFRYAATLFYLDLDELPHLFDGVRGWAYQKPRLGWFRRADYLGNPELKLADEVRAEIQRHLGWSPQGPIRLLTNLRIWGKCFNPISVYYCFEPGADKPSVVLAQVTNTPWNERHCYVFPCDPDTGKVDVCFDKHFHVSPFNPIDMHYHWISGAPEAQLLVHMENHQSGKCHMDATLNLKRQPWDFRALSRILWQQPWLSFKIPAAIYWQAFRLWLKRVPVYDHPAHDSARAAPDVQPITQRHSDPERNLP